MELKKKMIEKIKCTPQEATLIKVKIGNLIDCFTTGRIRKKDMEKYNDELNKIMTEIIDEKCCTFMSCEDALKSRQG